MAKIDTTQPAPLFLTEAQVAELICQSVRTVQKWRATGRGPDFYKFGQSVRYSVDDVRAWIATQRVSNPESQPNRPR
ncbi:AlpA family transcriptional regulator [Hasllibacter sp. MH4015]|uniref:helix-turn-helix transcriptional regulator n=1 Tax=Hasllibacter sp. MH4015 TaxID=2854029 RepID=UPI001CD50947|nr:helix-turn-helix domain-containing protein [Hasllibacter sp. MH4015]